jgi:hypothetical protein
MADEKEVLAELKRTRELVGELYPILVDKRGVIIDGFHRQKVGWKSIRKLDQIDSDVKAVLARILVHKVRREVTADEQRREVNRLAEILLTKKGVKPGRIGPLISELTGYSMTTIDAWLDEKYKVSKGPKPVPAGGGGVAPKLQPVSPEKADLKEQIVEAGKEGGKKGGRPVVWLWVCPQCGYKGPKRDFGRIRAS